MAHFDGAMAALNARRQKLINETAERQLRLDTAQAELALAQIELDARAQDIIDLLAAVQLLAANNP